MARSSLAQLAVLGVLGVFAYEWARQQPPASAARRTVEDLTRTFRPRPEGPPAAPSGPAEREAPALPWRGGQVQPTTLTDFGGIPVVYDPARNTLRQDPTIGGNVYAPGDSFYAPDGRIWTWTGRAGLLTSDGAPPTPVDDFLAPAGLSGGAGGGA